VLNHIHVAVLGIQRAYWGGGLFWLTFFAGDCALFDGLGKKSQSVRAEPEILRRAAQSSRFHSGHEAGRRGGIRMFGGPSWR